MYMYMISLSLTVLFMIISMLGKQTLKIQMHEIIISRVQADVEK